MQPLQSTSTRSTSNSSVLGVDAGVLTTCSCIVLGVGFWILPDPMQCSVRRAGDASMRAGERSPPYCGYTVEACESEDVMAGAWSLSGGCHEPAAGGRRG